MTEQKELKEQMAAVLSEQSELKKELLEERRLRKSVERKARSLQEKLVYANQERFGDRRQKVRKKTGSDTPEKPEPDRRNKKECFGGTEDTLCTDSVDNSQFGSAPENAGKERDLTKRPDEYKTMGVTSDPVFHPSGLSMVSGRIIERRSVPVFSLKTVLVEDRFEMVHYVEPGRKPEWGYFPSKGHPEVVTRFEGTTAAPEFLQGIAYEVYVKNVTFGLLHQWLTDMKMTISPDTLRNWLKKGKKYLDELGCVLKEIALEKDSIVHCDETLCKVRKYDHYKKCYIWVLVNKAQKVAIFFYENGSRGREVLIAFWGDAELKSIMSDGYVAYVFIGDELKSAQFKDTVHQVCLSHLDNKFVKVANQGGEPSAELFHDDIQMFFNRERRYNEAGLTPEERLRERQSLETKEIVIRIRSSMESEQEKETELRSLYYTEALNYLNKFRKELFVFLHDEELPIDYNPAERIIWKLTTQRNKIPCIMAVTQERRWLPLITA